MHDHNKTMALDDDVIIQTWRMLNEMVVVVEMEMMKMIVGIYKMLRREKDPLVAKTCKQKGVLRREYMGLYEGTWEGLLVRNR